MRPHVRTLLIAAAALLAGYAAYRLAAPASPPAPAATAPSASAARAEVSRLGRAAWSRGFTGGARVVGMAADAHGDVVITGALSGTVDFGGGPLPSAGEDDVFVVKLDPDGKPIWSKRLGGPGYQVPAGVAVDGEGAAVIVGTLDQTADFGGGPLSSAGLVDVFVLKLDFAGNHLWSRRFGDAAEQEASAVAVDREGDVFVAGSFEGTLDFGGGPLASAGADDVYLAKLDASGEHLWSKRFGDGRAQKGRALAADGEGGVVLAGQMEGTMDLGGGPLVAKDAFQLFVARFDASGRHLWSRTYGAAAGARVDPRAVAWGPRGVAVTGIARGATDLGDGMLAQVGAEEDAFVLALDASGGTRFARRFGGSGAVEPKAIAALGDGALVVGGQLEGTAGFGRRGSVTSAGKTDAFLLALDAEGVPGAAHTYGDAARQSGTSLTTVDGEVVFAGDLQGSADFGAERLIGPGVFVTRLRANSPPSFGR